MQQYDIAYKEFFSHPRMVKDLLRIALTPQLLAQLDTDTLEMLPTNFTSAAMRAQRFVDCIWRVRLRESGPAAPWVHLNLLLEFQSDVDRHMALRIGAYVHLFWQHLLKTGAVDAKGFLPPVFPIVIYNGKRRWKAPTRVADLVHPVNELLRPYYLGAEYLLLDEGCYAGMQFPPDNLAGQLLRLENATDAETVQPVVADLADVLGKTPDLHSLRRAFSSFISSIILSQIQPGWKPDRLDDLEEMRDMLQASVKTWVRDWKQEGRAEGRQEGRTEGRQEGRAEGVVIGQRRMLTGLLEKRFGALPEAVEQQLARADDAQLRAWSLLAVDATSLEQVFNQPS